MEIPGGETRARKVPFSIEAWEIQEAKRSWACLVKGRITQKTLTATEKDREVKAEDKTSDQVQISRFPPRKDL